MARSGTGHLGTDPELLADLSAFRSDPDPIGHLEYDGTRYPIFHWRDLRGLGKASSFLALWEQRLETKDAIKRVELDWKRLRMVVPGLPEAAKGAFPDTVMWDLLWSAQQDQGIRVARDQGLAALRVVDPATLLAVAEFASDPASKSSLQALAAALSALKREENDDRPPAISISGSDGSSGPSSSSTPAPASMSS